MQEKRYPSDLTDSQWERLHYFYKDQYNKQGRPPSARLREHWNAILYMTRSGCSWRMSPKEFPHWKTVYGHLRKLRNSGALEEMMSAFRQDVRTNIRKTSSPSVAIIDSQSVKSRSGKKISKGFDGYKCINGRKRHIMVDTLGLILATKVTSAGIQDRDMVIPLGEKMKKWCPRVETILADSAYDGRQNQATLQLGCLI